MADQKKRPSIEGLLRGTRTPAEPKDYNLGPGTFEEESDALRYLKKYYPKLYRERKARKTREHSVQQSKQYTSTATKRLRGA